MSEQLVLVTGAGFSASAGLPVQAAILQELLTTFDLQPGAANRSAFFGAREEVIMFLNAVFLGRGERVREIALDDAHALSHITLEDIYTVIDNAVLRRDWLLFYGWQQTSKVRDALDACVYTLISTRQKQFRGNQYDALAKRLVSQYGDSWSTINLNWDTVWDGAVGKFSTERRRDPNYSGGIRWFSDGSFSEVDSGSKLPGIQMLKLHGSFNWLVCERCHSVFASSTELAELGYYNPFECPSCLSMRPRTQRPALRPFFLTPTFIRNVENPHVSKLWDAATDMLAEASLIIFVGYSFPVADQDMRYMFRRALIDGSRVRVILSKRDDPAGVPDYLQGLMPSPRYKAFFRLGSESFCYEGWEGALDLGYFD